MPQQGRGVTGSRLKTSVFKEASKNLAFDFLINKDKQNFNNHLRIYRKY
jgi:UDP-N-acetylmuramyl pentapeptide synthase